GCSVCGNFYCTDCFPVHCCCIFQLHCTKFVWRNQQIIPVFDRLICLCIGFDFICHSFVGIVFGRQFKGHFIFCDLFQCNFCFVCFRFGYDDRCGECFMQLHQSRALTAR